MTTFRFTFGLVAMSAVICEIGRGVLLVDGGLVLLHGGVDTVPRDSQAQRG